MTNYSTHADILAATDEAFDALDENAVRRALADAMRKQEAQPKLRASPEEIARLDAVREIVLKNPGRLQMHDWHGEDWNSSHTPAHQYKCSTAHCIAGWLQALSPEKLIREMAPEDAGAALAPASVHMFWTEDDTALEWLRNRGYARKPA